MRDRIVGYRSYGMLGFSVGLVTLGVALGGGVRAADGVSGVDVTTRVSVSSGEAQGNGPSGVYSGGDSAISPDGRYVVFGSLASNLVRGDTNRKSDVFLRDRVTGITRRMSVRSNEAQGNSSSFDPAISANGRYVVFTSSASNLVRGDTNRSADVFVRDRVAGTTRRMSVRSNEAQGNRGSFDPAISADGRYVVFSSSASNLVLGDTNRQDDVFVRDRVAGTTRRVSVSSREAQNNGPSSRAAISAHGRYVAFDSSGSKLVSGDTNYADDVFVRDRRTGTTQRVSVSSSEAQTPNGDNGTSFDPAIAADGRYVAFTSWAPLEAGEDLRGAPEIYVRDRLAGTTELVSVALSGVVEGWSHDPAISPGGRYVAFRSSASTLVVGDTNEVSDVFVRDRSTNTTRRVSVSSDGVEADRDSFGPAISEGGRYVTFGSAATNLVAGDTNGAFDVFLRQTAP